jgi:hypothetical protein
MHHVYTTQKQHHDEHAHAPARASLDPTTTTQDVLKPAVAASKVATLAHEALDHTVEL